MEFLTCIVISFVILVIAYGWFYYLIESIKNLKHIIKVLKYRKNLKYMTDAEREEFLKGK